MRRTELLEEVRIMRFEEAYEGWRQRRLTQAEAARMLGVCERTFRRHMNRYEGSVNLGSVQVQGSVNGLKVMDTGYWDGGQMACTDIRRTLRFWTSDGRIERMKS